MKRASPLTSLSNYGKIDWSRGIASVLLVLRDDNGYPVSSSHLYRSKPTLDFSAFISDERELQRGYLTPRARVFAGWPEQLSDRTAEP